MAVVLSALAVASASAQSEQSFMDECTGAWTATVEALRDGVRDRQEQALLPGAETAAPTTTTAVALVAAQDGSRAIVSYSRNSQYATGDRSDFGLKASAPFDDNEGQGRLLTEEGVGGDFVLTASYGRFGWNLTPERYVRELCQACEDVGLDLLNCYPEKLADGRARKAGGDEPSKEQVAAASHRAEEIEEKLYGIGVGTFWGFEVSGGQKEREFFELDGSTDSEDRIGYAASILGGMLLKNNWSLYGKGSWKRDYDENDSVTSCSAVDDSSFMSCKDLPLGQAEESESLVVSAQAVRPFEKLFGKGPPWAIAPAAAYDIDESKWELQLPVYLLTNADGAFSGGVSASWQSEAADDEWSFSLFVTKPLQTWPE